ncbi:MAG TPA: hypothetical protein PKA20_03850 [Burkholderiaceae bacterium]|nr:hypothetical protein [Burkholderiaceae bacterium]
MNRLRAGAALGGALWLHLAQADRPAAQSAPAGPPVVPFAAQVGLVMPAGTVAGMPVAIVQFTTPLSVEQVLEQTGAAWSDGGRQPVVQAQAGAWRMISRHQGDEVLTLQVRERPGGGAGGLLSRWGAASAVADPAQAVMRRVLPDGARVMQTFGHRDGERRALTLTAASDLPAERIWQQTTSRLQRDGFLPDGPAQRAAPLAGTRAGFFRNGNTQMAVTLDARRQPGTLVFTLTTEAR